jgi:hypothetical protein
VLAAADDLGARMITAIDDRHYGLHEFVIANPDWFGPLGASAQAQSQPAACTCIHLSLELALTEA